MRYGLHFALRLFLSFAGASVVAFCVVWVEGNLPTRSVWVHRWEFGQVRHYEKLLYETYTATELAGLLGPHQEIPLSTDLLARNGPIESRDDSITDAWGKPFWITRCQRDASDKLSREFGVYTKGADGISISRGNDEDDFASWRSVDTPYWRNFERWWGLRTWKSTGVWTVAITFPLFLTLLTWHWKQSIRVNSV